MSKFYQGTYHPQNPEKYLGKKLPYFRSSWERKVCEFFDTNNNILGWSSESHRIPYVHPFTGKKTTYVPDFFVVYQDKYGNKHAELIEVKPHAQILGNSKKKRDKAAGIINEAKWKMAEQWCEQQGLTFRIITENDIFRNPSRK
jgi:hypothetical protein